MPVIIEEPSLKNEVCTHLALNNNSTITVNYCKGANDLETCEKPFERGWNCFWNGILPSTTPYTCTHLMDYSRDPKIVKKCKEIRVKVICLHKRNKECKFNPGDPNSPESNE